MQRQRELEPYERFDEETIKGFASDLNLRKNTVKFKDALRLVDFLLAFYPVNEERSKGLKRRKVEKIHLNQLLKDAKNLMKSLDTVMSNIDEKKRFDYHEVTGYVKREIANPEIIKNIENRIENTEYKTSGIEGKRKINKAIKNTMKSDYFDYCMSDYRNEPRVYDEWKQLTNLLQNIEYHIQRMKRISFTKPKETELYWLIIKLTAVFYKFHGYDEKQDGINQCHESFIIRCYSLLKHGRENTKEGLEKTQITERFYRYIQKARKEYDKFIEDEDICVNPEKKSLFISGSYPCNYDFHS